MTDPYIHAVLEVGGSALVYDGPASGLGQWIARWLLVAGARPDREVRITDIRIPRGSNGLFPQIDFEDRL